MADIQTIDTALYKLLKNDTALNELCTVYKGTKRPSDATNPSVTAGTKGIKPRDGGGIRICEIVVIIYADIMANRTADNTTHNAIMSRISELLADTEIDLENAKALPLREKENTGIEWKSIHDNETFQEIRFELTFIDFS
ncbi:hypothetical protein ACFL6H_04820 [Candidatus Latescibacterota bacterium]